MIVRRLLLGLLVAAATGAVAIVIVAAPKVLGREGTSARSRDLALADQLRARAVAIRLAHPEYPHADMAPPPPVTSRSPLLADYQVPREPDVPSNPTDLARRMDAVAERLVLGFPDAIQEAARREAVALLAAPVPGL
jgi:hypothetical protein